MKKLLAFVLPVMLLSMKPGSIDLLAQETLRVVTTLPDLKSITDIIGGDRVTSFAIATGFQNPHFVDPKPSYITRLSRADMFVTVGLDLETGWVPSLLNASRNPRILQGADGYVDASVGVPLLQTPTSTSRAQGDIHVYGNPHYWLDPVRGKVVAQNIFEGLSRLRPAERSYFEQNLARFNDQIDEALADWLETMAPFAGAKVIAYHNEWPYFEKRFDFRIVDFLEPKPGIPPTPSQLAKVIGLIQQEGIGVIITSPYFKKDAAELVSRKTGARVVTLATSVGAEKGIHTYFDLFSSNVAALARALQDAAVTPPSD